MKPLILTHLVFLLSLLSFYTQAQNTACEDQGFVVQALGTPTDCASSATGQATVSSTGCSCMFSGCTYQWSDGQSFHTAFNLSAGTYNVTVTHPPDSLGNICIATVEVIVEDGAEMIDNVLQTELKCPDGNDASISIVPSLFAGQLSYQWSTGDTTATISNLLAGNYSVTVSNFENCTQQMDITIAAPNLQIMQTQTTPACGGLSNGKIELLVESTNSYTALAINSDDQEFTDLNALPAGDYMIIVSDENGCSVDTEITINVIPVPDINFLYTGSLSICAGEFKNLVVQVPGATSYNWQPTTGVSGSNAVYLSPTQTTTYTVTAQLPSGCTATKDITITVDNCNTTNINDADLQVFDNIYPNPSNGLFWVNATQAIANYTLYDMSGKIIEQKNTNNTQVLLDLTPQATGIYFLQVTTHSGGASMQKLLKQ